MSTTKYIIALACSLLVTAVAAFGQDPVPMYPHNYKVLFENDRVRVLDFILRKGDKEEFHTHPSHVAYILSPLKIQFTFPDGRTAVREAKAGDVLFSEAVTHSPVNIGDVDAHGILVELKGSPKSGGSGGMTEGSSTESDQDLLTAVTFIHGLEGKGEELKGELLALEAPTRAEPGNLVYDLYQSPTVKHEFMRFEVWRNPKALEEHKMTPHLQASFKHRQEQGWKTEITTWKRVKQ